MRDAGAEAAGFSDGVAPEEAQARLVALQDLQRSLTLAYHRSRVGQQTEVLLEGDSRRGAGQSSGRDPYHRVVNFSVSRESALRPGHFVPLQIVEATPHSLIGEPQSANSGARMRETVKQGARGADGTVRSAVVEG